MLTLKDFLRILRAASSGCFIEMGEGLDIPNDAEDFPDTWEIEGNVATIKMFEGRTFKLTIEEVTP